MFITEGNNFAGSFAFVEDERYQTEDGLGLIAFEEAENSTAFFNAMVRADQQEIAMIKEGASDYEVQAFQEGVISSVWEKIKEWVKKIWNKIKNYFKAFIARLESFFKKDAKAFYDKYKNILNGGQEIKNLHVNYAEFRAGFVAGDLGLSGYFDREFTDIRAFANIDPDDIDEDQVLRSITNNKLSDAKRIKEDMHDLMFDSKSKEEVTQGNLQQMISGIVNDEAMKQAKRASENYEKALTALNKHVDRLSKEFFDAYGRDTADNKSDTKDYTVHGNGKNIRVSNGVGYNTASVNLKGVTHFKRYASLVISLGNKVSAAFLNCWKEHVSQSRKIASIVVSYLLRHKKVGEAAMLESVDLDF